MDLNYWVCEDGFSLDSCGGGQACDIKELKARMDWAPTGQSTTGCYSSQFEEHCKLEIAAHLAITVVAITFVKVLMLAVRAFYGVSTPILTVGDAISSFLVHPDPNTVKMPFLQFGDAIRDWAWHPAPKYWLRSRQRRMYATGPTRRRAFLAM